MEASDTGEDLRYVLVTPARNEADFIELTIQSVIAQTVRPVKWVIVSDGSTDGTDDIVKRYIGRNPWIELVRMPERRERSFAGKAHAFNAGYQRVRHLQFDVIGNVDADTSFEPDYFGFLLSKFRLFPGLGVAGTPFREGSFQYDYRFVSLEHVSGACQLFRRQCFEEIGGYLPLEVGGVDLVAVTTARMRGWETRSFSEKTYQHHRMTQGGGDFCVSRAFTTGCKDYLLGVHPVWEVCRAAHRMTKRPFLVIGAALLAGYSWALIRRVSRPVPPEFVAFRRAEQMRRLRNFLVPGHSQRKEGGGWCEIGARRG